MITREAVVADAPSMVAMLNRIIAKGGTTAHRTPYDVPRMIDDYVTNPRGIACTVAAGSGGEIAGFQSLEWSDPEWPGGNTLPADWAVIASFVSLDHHGQGIGRMLFEATLSAARAAGVRAIDATIRKENLGGLAFYGRLGFVDYRESDLAVSKRLDL